MIVRVAQDPRVFELDFSENKHISSAEFRLLLNTLLEPIVVNPLIVLIADKDPVGKSTILRQMFALFQSWPPKYGNKAKSYLEYLIKKQKVDYVLVSESSDRHPMEHAISADPHIVVLPDLGHDSVIANVNNLDAQYEVCCPADIEDTQYWLHHKNRKSMSIPEGEPAREVLLKTFYVPLFRHSRTVEMFDHYLGINMVDFFAKVSKNADWEIVIKDENGAPEPPYDFRVSIKHELANYLEPLETIVAHVRSTLASSKSVFELHTTLGRKNDWDQQRIAAVKAASSYLIKWANWLSSDELQVKIDMVKPNHQKVHDRYLTTNQAFFLVGRGVALWDEHGLSREITITLADDDYNARSFYNSDRERITTSNITNLVGL